jgi:hypothetical protein
MPFEMPSDFTKKIADTTAKVYKSKLNKLAGAGYDTVEKLQTKPKEVIEAIQELTGSKNDEPTRHARRYFLSAIFWATPLPAQNEYYKYWQKCIPLKTDDGDKWVKRSNFTP